MRQQLQIAYKFCYGHRLQNHAGKCRHLHGHNARLLVTLAGERDVDSGMVLDFGEVKEVLRRVLDTDFDHTLFLERSDPLVPLLHKVGEKFRSLDMPPTAEVLAENIFHALAFHKLPVVAVELWETDDCCANYAVSKEGG